MTTAHPVDLPDFGDPPVVETLLSVQFDPLLLPKTAHFGLYWDRIRSRFPQTAEQGELPTIVEKQPDQSPMQVGIQLQTLEIPPTPRFWFIDKDGAELIQVQRDRFIKNWRKVEDRIEYPRYEKVREGFDRDFDQFTRFIEQNGLGTVRVNQCEVTYINHIVSGQAWSTHSEVERVFTVWKQPSSEFPGPAQDVGFRARFPIANEGKFCGRLHVNVQSVRRISDGKPMFVMELTARGQLGSGTDFFDVGRRWIVKSFVELTTPEMQSVWGRRS